MLKFGGWACIALLPAMSMVFVLVSPDTGDDVDAVLVAHEVMQSPAQEPGPFIDAPQATNGRGQTYVTPTSSVTSLDSFQILRCYRC